MSERMLLNEALVVDSTHATEGIIHVATTQDTQWRLKLKVNGVYYDLNASRVFETFPLVDGSGKYDIRLYRQTMAKSRKYTCVGRVTLRARLYREDAAFLRPNQWIEYDSMSPWILMAHQLCQGMNDEDSFTAIRRLVRKNLRYDYVRAIRTPAGERPDISRCWENGMGTCQDLAALAVSMMRARGIPAQLVIGKADGKNHAWVQAKVDRRRVQYDPTAEIVGVKAKKYVIGRIY